MLELLPTPAVVIDLDVADRNIARAAKKIRNAGLKHRPHIKTHKSAYFASKQVEAGASGITCAKLGEAEAMAAAGFTDILIAYPLIGQDKMDRLFHLSQKCKITVCVDSLEGAQAISAVGEKLGNPVLVYIEVNVGFDRCGRKPGEEALHFAKHIQKLPGIHITGVMSYAGHINDQKSVPDIRSVVNDEVEKIVSTAKLLNENGIEAQEISVGSSLSVEFAEDLTGVTEIRAGSYIFHDVSHVMSGMFSVEECALRVIVTVISIPLPGHAIIDAGTKTLTSDTSRRSGYGYVMEHPDIEIFKLNEEHGFIKYDQTRSPLKIGDRLTVIPNHACVIPNLCDELIGVRGGHVVEHIPVNARGKNK